MSKRMMHAIRVHQYGGLEQLKLEQIPCPEPQAGEVLIRVHSAGVLPAEWKLRQGLFQAVRPVRFPYIRDWSRCHDLRDRTGGVWSEHEWRLC